MSSRIRARCVPRNGTRVSAASGAYVAWTSQTVSMAEAGATSVMGLLGVGVGDRCVRG